MSASGIISSAQDIWKQMLEACQAVKDGGWTLYHDRLPLPTAYADEYTAEDLDNYLPFGIVWTDPTAGFEFDAIGQVGEGGEYWQPSGVLAVEFYRAAPIPPDDESFRNFLGLTIKSGDRAKPGLVELAGTGGYLALNGLRVFGPVVSVPEEYPEFGKLQTMMLVARWS